MNTRRRIQRLNEQLKRVIYDTIIKRVDDPSVKNIFSITRVKTSSDIRYAKVFISLHTNDEKERDEIFRSLVQATEFIQVQASKKMNLRYFPELTFILDDSIQEASEMYQILDRIKEDHSE